MKWVFNPSTGEYVMVIPHAGSQTIVIRDITPPEREDEVEKGSQ